MKTILDLYLLKVLLDREDLYSIATRAKRERVKKQYFISEKEEAETLEDSATEIGTLDEGFELLTLLQTGKAEPAPVILLDVPGGTFWHGWSRFMAEEVEPRGLVSEDDRSFFTITDDVERLPPSSSGSTGTTARAGGSAIC